MLKTHETPEFRAARAQLDFIAKFRNVLKAQDREIAQKLNPVVKERHVAFIDPPKEKDPWDKDFQASLSAHEQWVATQKANNLAKRSASK